MAIIGIAGCAGLMVAGVGLKDSLSSVSAKQFGPIIDYQAIVTTNQTDETSQKEINDAMDDQAKITDRLAVDSQTIELRKRPSITKFDFDGTRK